MPIRWPSPLRKLFAYWLTPAGNRLRVFPDDTFLVSYPRSGNTWLRFVLGEIIFYQEVNFENMETLVPDIYRVSRAHLNRLPRPRYIKSHEPYDARYPRVVYLLRDPRDVAISYYYWLLKFRHQPEGDLAAFLETFTADQTPYGGWGGHVRSWLAHPNCLFVRYEDLLARPEEKLKEIVDFLHLSTSENRITKALAHNAFERMKGKEAQNQQAPIFTDTRRDIPFIRSGQAGQWRETLTPSQCRLFAEAYGDLLTQFGYDIHA